MDRTGHGDDHLTALRLVSGDVGAILINAYEHPPCGSVSSARRLTWRVRIEARIMRPVGGLIRSTTGDRVALQSVIIEQGSGLLPTADVAGPIQSLLDAGQEP